MALPFSENKIDNPEMTFNWNATATQFTIEYDLNKKKSTVVKSEMPNENDIDDADPLPRRP